MKHFLGCDSQEVRIGKKETKLFMLLLKAKVTLLILLFSMTSLMEHTVVKFVYSKKATKIDEIFTVNLTLIT